VEEWGRYCRICKLNVGHHKPYITESSFTMPHNFGAAPAPTMASGFDAAPAAPVLAPTLL
jgi:hypothetical protein